MKKRILASVDSVYDTNVQEFVRDYKTEYDLWCEAGGSDISNSESDRLDWITEERYEDLLHRYVAYHSDSYLEENFFFERLHYERNSSRVHRFLLYSKMPVYQIVLAYSFQGVSYSSTHKVCGGSDRPTVGSKYVLYLDDKEPNTPTDCYEADSITEFILTLRDHFISKWK